MNNCPQCGSPIPMGSNTCQLCGYVMPEEDFYSSVTPAPVPEFSNAKQLNDPVIETEKETKSSHIWQSIVGTLVIIIIAIVIFYFSTHHISCKTGNERYIIFYNDKEAYFCISWPLFNCEDLEVINQEKWSFESFDKYFENKKNSIEAIGGKCTIR